MRPYRAAWGSLRAASSLDWPLNPYAALFVFERTKGRNHTPKETSQMIIRSEFKGNYTQIHNEIFNNPDLSAKGILAQLLSKPDSWRLNIKYLVNTNKEGDYAIRSAVKELEDQNYIHRFVTRENGKIAGTEYLICDRVTSRADAEAFFNKTCMQDNSIQVFCMLETGPIINTEVNNHLNKQTLKETTTTQTQGVDATMEQARAMPVQSSCSSNQILNLISDKHKSPMVVTFVNKAIVDYTAKEVEQAVAYAASNVRGGSLQFKAYLDKTLKNKWADGWEPDPEYQADKHAIQEQFKLAPDSNLQILAEVGNVVALQELKRRGV